MAATVVTTEGHSKQYESATHLRVTDDGTLIVFRKEEKKRIKPISLLWGMINFDHEIDESVERSVAVFPRGAWSRWEAFGQDGHPTT
jgi:hypothetical protein